MWKMMLSPGELSFVNMAVRCELEIMKSNNFASQETDIVMPIKAR